MYMYEDTPYPVSANDLPQHFKKEKSVGIFQVFQDLHDI